MTFLKAPSWDQWGAWCCRVMQAVCDGGVARVLVLVLHQDDPFALCIFSINDQGRGFVSSRLDPGLAARL